MGLGKYISAGAARTRGLYHMEGNSNDSSGNNNNGSDTNISYSLNGATQGKAAIFTRIPAGDIVIGSGSTFQFGDVAPFTVRALVRADYASGIIVSNHNANVAGGWSVTKHVFPTTRMTIQRTDWGQGYPGAGYNQAEKTYNIDEKSRLHVTFVYDPNETIVVEGNTLQGTIRVLINGEPGDKLVSLSQESNNNTAYIGAQKIDDMIGTTFGDGPIDEVVIEPRVWSKRYIDRDYAQSIGRTAPMII